MLSLFIPQILLLLVIIPFGNAKWKHKSGWSNDEDDDILNASGGAYIHYHPNTNGHAVSGGFQTASSFNRAGGLGDFQNTGCSDEYGGSDQAMYQMLQPISSNINTILNLLQNVLDTQLLFKSRLDDYDTRLVMIDRKLDRISNQVPAELQDLSHAIHYSEKNSRTIKKLKEIEFRNRDVSSGVNTSGFGSGLTDDVFESLKDTLQSFADRISRSRENELIDLSQLQKNIHSITQSLKGMYRSNNNRGGSSMDTDELMTTLERFHQNTTSSIEDESLPTLGVLVSLRDMVRNGGSLSIQLSSTVNSLSQLQQVMKNIDAMLIAIKKQSKKGCKIEIGGGIQKQVITSKKRKRNEYQEEHDEEEIHLSNQRSMAAQSVYR